METGTAAAAAAVETTNVEDCLEKIFKIAHEVEREIKDREANFQAQMQRAIEETRHRVEEDCRAERERAVSEMKETTRRHVTDQLLTRFHVEITQLQTNFDRRLHDVTAQAEAREQLKVESAVMEMKQSVRQQTLAEAKNEYQSRLDEMEKLVGLLNESATAGATEWQAERQKFQDRIAMLERLLDTANAAGAENLDHYKDLERKLEDAMQSKAQLQRDLERAVSELNSKLRTAADAASDRAAHGEVAAVVQSEMIRARVRLDEIERMMSDPGTELGFEIRLNREYAELQAYLKGLRYSLGEVTLQSSTSMESCHA
jgi:chromosome segregation ATPase